MFVLVYESEIGDEKLNEQSMFPLDASTMVNDDEETTCQEVNTEDRDEVKGDMRGGEIREL